MDFGVGGCLSRIASETRPLEETKTHCVRNLLGVVVIPPSDGGPRFLRGDTWREA